jgi:hypothetical protein
MAKLSSPRTTRSRAIKSIKAKSVKAILSTWMCCSCGLIANIAPAAAQEPVTGSEVANQVVPVATQDVPANVQPPTNREPEASAKPPVANSQESPEVISEEPPEIPIPQFSDTLLSDTPGLYLSPGEQQPGETTSDQNGSDAASSTPAVQVGMYRFQTPASKDYLVQRARAESAARNALLERYRKAGWNYGQPTIDSNVWYSLRTTPRYKNFFVVPMRPVIE